MEKGILVMLRAFTLIACGLLVFVLSAAIVRGLPAIDAVFLTAESKNFGLEGGIFYQTLGTLILISGAAAVGLPIALGSALFQTEYLRRAPRLKKSFRVLMDALNSAPTIVFGLVGYLVFGAAFGVSWLTGAFTLAVMILPTMQSSMVEAFEALPETYREAGKSLGMGRGAIIRSILLPQCFYGAATGLFLGLARAAGETAAILFTATTFSGVTIPESASDPATTLQTHIFTLAQEGLDPRAAENAWGAALVLLTLVFVLLSAAMWIRSRLHWESAA